MHPRLIGLPILALLPALLLSPTAPAQESVIAQVATPAAQPPAARLTAIVVSATNAPLGVLGSDGLEHLEYDLLVTNAFSSPVTLGAVEVLAADGHLLLRLAGDALVAATQPLLGMEPTVEIPASGTVAVMIDLAVAPDQVPSRVGHRLTYEIAPGASGASLIAHRRIDGPELVVDPRPPVTIAPPVHGPGWLNANSCCDALSIHRSIRNAVDGARIVKPETFAIDWILLRDGAAFSGAGERPEQWFGHGAEITVVALGTVVFVRDGLAEGAPYSLPPVLEQPADAGGNQIIVRIAPDAWAFYAHLQPGSVTVAVGDEVATGQPLGRLGNSGNSIAPHLHFGLLDGPDPMTATSLPFVIDRYVLAGAVDPDAFVAVLTNAGPPELRAEGTPRPESGTLPLNLTVTDFR